MESPGTGLLCFYGVFSRFRLALGSLDYSLSSLSLWGSSLDLSLGSLDLWGVRWFYPRFVGFMGCSLDYRFLIEKRNNDGGLFSVLCTISIYSWCRAVELFEFSAKIRRAFKACGFRNA